MYNLFKGLKVLDLTNVLAGPFCTYHLALLGAEVLKIERPATGDLARRLGVAPDLNAHLMGTSFIAQNAGKKSIVLDLKDEEGIGIFLKLAANTDVIVENFRPGVVDRLGVGYERIRKINHSVIYCSISGFGWDSPYADRPAYDQTVQGMSGVMSVNGTADLNPLRCGFPICDTAGGLTAAMAIAAALYSREKEGSGTHIDISLLDATLPMLAWTASNYLVGGQKPVPFGNDNFTAAPSGMFVTRDGYINISANEEKQWISLCHAIGKPELVDDERFNERSKRKQNRQILNQIINVVLKTRDTDDWVASLTQNGVPCGEVCTLEQVFASEHVNVRRMLLNMEIEKPRKKFRVLNIAPRFRGRETGTVTPPPILGESTAGVLREQGYPETEIAHYLEKHGLKEGQPDC